MLAVPLFAANALVIANSVAEAGNQGFVGMVAVTEVVRNRMERRYQSDGTVHGTIFKAKQFSWTNDSTPWRSRIFGLRWDDPRVQLAQRAWQRVFGDDDPTLGRSDITKGAVLYHTIQPPWPNLDWPPRWATAETVKETARIGDHVFYDDIPAGGKKP